MNLRSRSVQRLIIGLLLATFFGVALYLRLSLPYDQVFGTDWTKFTGVDAYWHMRIIDNLVHNFPHLNSFDPYMLYPGGAGTSSTFPFFDYLVGGVIWILGLGSPTQHTVDVIAAYFPAILGGLTIIPAFFIGKTLFSPWAGVVAAGLVAIFPGEFLGRSILGFTDHHVAEVFFTTVAMAFLVAAVKSAREKELSLDHIRHLDNDRLKKPVILSALAGISLGVYLITWQGSLLFIFILAVYLVIQAVVDHLRKEPGQYLSIVLGITFFLALIISVPVSRYAQYTASLALALVGAILLPVLSNLMHRRQLSPTLFPVSLVVLGAAGFGILYAVDSLLARSMVSQLDIFSWPMGTTVLEMQPLLFPGGEFSFSVVWGNFNMSLIVGIVALGMLVCFLIRRNAPHQMLFLIWTLVILAATLAQRRFNYYLAVNVALLSGFFCWEVLHFVGLGKETVPVASPTTRSRKKKRKQKPKKALKDVRVPARYVYVAIASLILFFAVYFPNIGPARSTASQTRFAPSDAWCETLSWLENNSPEPFGDPEFYYATYERPFDYPDTAYGVTAWWDYGYWIVRIGHRMPSQNPSGAKTNVASVFVKQDEASANEVMDELGAKYFVIDYDMVTSKFHAPATISGGQALDYYDVFYELDEAQGLLTGRLFYFPEYYRSFCVRLYNFGGEAVVPTNSTVITWQDRFSQEGMAYKEIVDRRDFNSYEAALQYVTEQDSDHCRLVGENPFSSPVPLEEMTNYTPVYDSSIRPNQYGVPIPAVRVFEYSG